MTTAITSVLLGTKRTTYRRALALVLAIGLFGATLAGYAIGIFSVSGGLVWVPYYAAVVGMAAAGGVGYYRDGLVIAWLVTYASLLGYHADHAFFGLSRRSLVEQLAYFLRLDGLMFLAVEGIVLGTLAFGLGYLARWGVDSLWNGTAAASDDRG